MCDKLTTKYYATRNHPPFDAATCVGQVKTGNDGKRYVALESQTSRGKYRWYRNVGSAKKRLQSSAGKTKRVSASTSLSSSKKRKSTSAKKTSAAKKRKTSTLKKVPALKSGSKDPGGPTHLVASNLAAALANREPISNLFLRGAIERAEEELKVARDYGLLRVLDLNYNRAMDILVRAVANERRFGDLDVPWKRNLD